MVVAGVWFAFADQVTAAVAVVDNWLSSNGGYLEVVGRIVEVVFEAGRKSGEFFSAGWCKNCCEHIMFLVAFAPDAFPCIRHNVEILAVKR